MTEVKKAPATEADKELAGVICTEKCAQAGDPPCSRVSSDPHCDECIGSAMAVRAHQASQPAPSGNVAELVEPSDDERSQWLEATEQYVDGLEQTLTSQQAELEALRAQRDNAIQQAQGWKMEANAHKSSLHEAYQHVTGSTGEPGNWNGANPIIEALQKQGEA